MMQLEQADEVVDEGLTKPEAADTTPPEQAEPEGGDKPDDKQDEPEQSVEDKLKALQRRYERAEKKIQKLYAQREEARTKARLFESQPSRLTESEDGDTNQPAADSDTLSVSRADLQKLIQAEAKRLAPVLSQQEALTETRSRSALALRQELGDERFLQLTEDLADIFPSHDAQFAVLEVEAPRAVLEYLTDPEHEAEARGIARLPSVAQGIALAKLSVKLAKPKPEASKAPPPVERQRDAGGRFAQGYSPNMSDAEYAAWRKEQIARRNSY